MTDSSYTLNLSDLFFSTNQKKNETKKQTKKPHFFLKDSIHWLRPTSIISVS